MQKEKKRNLSARRKPPSNQKKQRQLYRIMHGENSKLGDGYIDVVVMCLSTMIVFCTLLAVAPVFLTKLSLDNYANELAREAEIAGRIGTETTARLNRLNETKGLFPTVTWDRTGNIQIGEDVNVTVTMNVDIGFYEFGSIPINLSSTATGTSEVLWK